MCVQGSSGESNGEEVQTVVRLVLEQMEALAVSTAAGELTPALVPGLTHTLASVSHAPTASQGISGVWACLADLFCSSDPRSAQVCSAIYVHICTSGNLTLYMLALEDHYLQRSCMVQLAESWLLRLLVAAAEKHLEEQKEDAAPALLPSRPSTNAG